MAKANSTGSTKASVSKTTKAEQFSLSGIEAELCDAQAATRTALLLFRNILGGPDGEERDTLAHAGEIVAERIRDVLDDAINQLNAIRRGEAVQP